MKLPDLSAGVTFAAVSATNIAIVVAGVPPKACALTSAGAGVYSAAKGRPWWSLLYFVSAYATLASAAYLEQLQARAATPKQLPPPSDTPQTTIAGIRSASAAERHRRNARHRR